MGFKIYNYTPNKFRGMIKILKLFVPFAKDRLKFDRDPIIKLLDREHDKAQILGKTAFYDPDKMVVSVFTYGRHPKDIMRSIAHELVHHAQACRGDLGNESTPEGYAQNDKHLRKMEKEAYLEGNMCFRDFTDALEQDPEAMRLKILNLEKDNMKPLKEWKEEEMFRMLMERFIPEAKKEVLEETELEEEVQELEEKKKKAKKGEKPLSPAQEEIASKAPPTNKITGADFRKLRKATK